MGGGSGTPPGLTATGAGPGSARGRDLPRRPPARDRHLHCPGLGRLTLAPTVRVFKPSAFRHHRALRPGFVFPDLEHDALAVSHLWLRAAPMSGEEGPSPLKSFLEPLNLTRGEKYGDRHGLPFPPCPASHGRSDGLELDVSPLHCSRRVAPSSAPWLAAPSGVSGCVDSGSAPTTVRR